LPSVKEIWKFCFFSWVVNGVCIFVRVHFVSLEFFNRSCVLFVGLFVFWNKNEQKSLKTCQKHMKLAVNAQHLIVRVHVVQHLKNFLLCWRSWLLYVFKGLGILIVRSITSPVKSIIIWLAVCNVCTIGAMELVKDWGVGNHPAMSCNIYNMHCLLSLSWQWCSRGKHRGMKEASSLLHLICFGRRANIRKLHIDASIHSLVGWKSWK